MLEIIKKIIKLNRGKIILTYKKSSAIEFYDDFKYVFENVR